MVFDVIFFPSLFTNSPPSPPKQILSNPDTRAVYDIYGVQGLEAGLTVGTKLKSTDELRREWEAFRAKQATARLDAKVAHRGAYVVKLDATELVSPYDEGVGRTPDLAGMAMTTQVHIPLGDSAGATLGGQVGVRRGAGGGAFVAGIRRVVDAATTIDAHAQLGLRSLLTLASTRALDDRSSSSVAVTWQPPPSGGGAMGGGVPSKIVVVGLTLTSARRLSDTLDGEAIWTVGPAGASGAAVGLTRRGAAVTVGGRVEVGAATQLSARVVWRPAPGVAARLVARVGTGGAEVELGATRRLSDVATAGVGLAVGSSGVTLRPRFSRGGHAFDFPILLARGVAPIVDDGAPPERLLVAIVGPPLLGVATQVFVVRPLRRFLRARAAASRGDAGDAGDIVAAARARASDQARLLAPVARRRAAKDAASGGIVIVWAAYGSAGGLDTLVRRSSRVDTASDGAAAAATTSKPTQPAAVDVTAALRLLVAGGRLTLPSAPTRAGLLGFFDPCPGTAKALDITYVHRGTPVRVRIPDGKPVDLPAASPRVLEGEAAAAARAAAEDLAPGAGAPPVLVSAGGGANGREAAAAPPRRRRFGIVG